MENKNNNNTNWQSMTACGGDCYRKDLSYFLVFKVNNNDWRKNSLVDGESLRKSENCTVREK